MATFTPFRQYKSCTEALCRGCPPFTQLDGSQNGGGGTDVDGNSVPLGPTGLKLMHYCFASRTDCCSCESYDVGIPKDFGTSAPTTGPDEGNFSGPPEKPCGPIVMTWYNLNGCDAADSQKICCAENPTFEQTKSPMCFASANKTSTVEGCLGDLCCPGADSAHACGTCGGCDSPCPPLNQITGKEARNAICACCACKSEEWGCYDDQEPCGKQWDVAAKGWITKGNCGGGDPPIDDPPIDDPPIDPPPECPDPPCGGGACP